MVDMNISLPLGLKAFVETCVAEGNYSDVSDYLRDVLRKQQELKDYKNYLRESIREGVESPLSDYSRSDTLEKMRATVGP